MRLPPKARKSIDILSRQGLGPLLRQAKRHVGHHVEMASRRTRGRWIGLTGNSVSFGGCTFDVSPRSVDVYTKANLAAGRYEADEVSFLDLLPPDRPLVELGACMGVVSCLSNRRLADPSRHAVVEANPHMLPLIRENARRNGSGFHVVHAAVTYAEGGFVDFGIGDLVFTSRAGSGDGVETVRVPAVTLKSLFDAEGLQGSISLICDIEGAEVAMIDRDREALERVDWFMAEFHPGLTGEQSGATMRDTLQSVGLSLVERRNGTHLFRRT